MCQNFFNMICLQVLCPVDLVISYWSCILVHPISRQFLANTNIGWFVWTLKLNTNEQALKLDGLRASLGPIIIVLNIGQTSDFLDSKSGRGSIFGWLGVVYWLVGWFFNCLIVIFYLFPGASSNPKIYLDTVGWTRSW